MADNGLFDIIGGGYRPSLIDAIIYNVKKLFKTKPPIPDPPVPYDLDHYNAVQVHMDGDDIAKSEAYKDFIYESIKGHMPEVNEGQLNSAIGSLASKELKPGDKIKVKDGYITYEEIQEVARNVENVSQKDASFGDNMPRIFIFPQQSAGNTEGNKIMRNLEILTGNNIIYFNYYNALSVGQEFCDSYSKEEVKGAFAHEFGHRIIARDKGYDVPMYNIEKHAAILGDDFKETCGSAEDLNKTYECYKTISNIIITTEFAKNSIESKKNELQRRSELSADSYAALAGYSQAMIEYNQKTDYTYTINKDNLKIYPDDFDHPNGKDRIKNIEMIMADIPAAKAKLEAEIAILKTPELPFADAGIGNKTPLPPQTSLATKEKIEL